VEDVRLAFGGIGTKPWRSRPAEDALRGRPLTADTIADAGRALIRDAVPRRENGFKVELVQRALTGVLSEQGGIR
jgi:xanthine dehydrogenase YagS FAD-binding subunit